MGPRQFFFQTCYCSFRPGTPDLLESPGGGVGPDSPTSVPRAAELAAARGGGQICLPGTLDLLKSTPDVLIGTSDLLSNQLQICSTTGTTSCGRHCIISRLAPQLECISSLRRTYRLPMTLSGPWSLVP